MQWKELEQITSWKISTLFFSILFHQPPRTSTTFLCLPFRLMTIRRQNRMYKWFANTWNGRKPGWVCFHGISSIFPHYISMIKTQNNSILLRNIKRQWIDAGEGKSLDSRRQYSQCWSFSSSSQNNSAFEAMPKWQFQLFSFVMSTPSDAVLFTSYDPAMKSVESR